MKLVLLRVRQRMHEVKSARPIYRRILLKLSGEALMGQDEFGINPDVLDRIAGEVAQVRNLGVQIGIVIGGGNLVRGAGLAAAGMERVTADHMGMLATVMNALALQDALERCQSNARVMSAIRINEVCEDYIRRRAIRHMEKDRVVIFAAGTGNPFFTTDSAASLRAIEINADVMLKATKVDGIYSADPMLDPAAQRYEQLTFDEALLRDLKVMDATAIVMCREHQMPLKVFNIYQPGALQQIVCGANIGTTVLQKQPL